MCICRFLSYRGVCSIFKMMMHQFEFVNILFLKGNTIRYMTYKITFFIHLLYMIRPVRLIPLVLVKCTLQINFFCKISWKQTSLSLINIHFGSKAQRMPGEELSLPYN